MRVLADLRPTLRRIAVCAPTGRDALVIGALLRDARLTPVSCDTVTELCRLIPEDIGVAVVAEEGLAGDRLQRLEAALGRQPEWSELPVIILTRQRSRLFEGLSSAIYIERPMRKETFIRQVLVALRWRARQYELRDYLQEREEFMLSLKRAKDEAERANASKSAFLAAASHDLRQPMQAITLLHAVLAKKVVDPDLRTMVAQLGAATKVVKNTLDALLDINQLERGQVTPRVEAFPVDDVLQRLQAQFLPSAQAKGLTLTVMPCHALVRSDPNLFERILHNLVSNAIKYTESGRVLVGCRHRGRSVRIEVWDSGIGIPEKHLSAIFEEFYQVDNPSRDRLRGTGLGLSMAQRLAHLLGLELTVRSTVGKGSVFCLTAPLGDQAAAAPPANDPNTAVAARPLNILVIEDDDLAGEALRALLLAQGDRVTLASDLAGALAAVAGADGTPDAVIADYNLGTITGPQVIQRLWRRLGQAVPALVLTGDVREQARHEVKAAGLPFLPKPLPEDDLFAWIDHVRARLRQAGPRAPARHDHP